MSQNCDDEIKRHLQLSILTRNRFLLCLNEMEGNDVDVDVNSNDDKITRIRENLYSLRQVKNQIIWMAV